MLDAMLDDQPSACGVLILLESPSPQGLTITVRGIIGRDADNLRQVAEWSRSGRKP